MRSKITKWSGLALVLAVALAYFWSTRRGHEIQPGDYLEVEATGTLFGQPIAGVRRVDEDGKITLGSAYGRVKVEGMNVDAATATIETALKMVCKEPQVAVSRLGAQVAPWIEAENRRLASENYQLLHAPRGTTAGAR